MNKNMVIQMVESSIRVIVITMLNGIACMDYVGLRKLTPTYGLYGKRIKLGVIILDMPFNQ